MIGLMFAGILIIWIAIAVTLGTKLPKWLGIQRFRPWISLLLVPLIFFSPVADEIIAYPQMQALCKQVNGLVLASGMSEEKVVGKSFYYIENNNNVTLWPPSVKILRRDYAYVDAATKEVILHGVWFEPVQGMLGIPNGSSGGRMTLILGKCDSKTEAYDNQDVPTKFGHLKLKKSSTQ